MKPDCFLFERNRRRCSLAAFGQACVQPYFLEKLMDAR